MVDVYVVTLLTALVQFGFLGNVQPGNALVAFAAVVVLTMLAAETFDPRLLDTPQEQPGDFPTNAFNHMPKQWLDTPQPQHGDFLAHAFNHEHA